MKYAYILVAVVMYGLGGALMRPISGTPESIGEVSSFAIGGVRSVLAFALTLLLLWPIDCWRKGKPMRLPRFKRQSPWVWASATSRAINTLAFSTAIVFCSVGTGYLLCNTTIIGMLFWAYAIDRKLPSTWQIVTGVVVTVSCFCTIAFDTHYATTIGAIAGVVGLFSFSGFFFFNGKIAEEDGADCILGAVMLSHVLAPLFALFAIAVCFFISDVAGDISSWARLWQPIGVPSLKSIGFLLLIGVFQGGLPDWFIAKGQALRPNMMFMAFMPTLIMLWAPFLAWQTLGEEMFSLRSAIPFAIAHFAILYASLRGAQETRLRLAIVAE